MNFRSHAIIALLELTACAGFILADESSAHRAFGGIQPAISPDGRTIALSYQGAICQMPADGGTLTRLTRGEGWDIEPAWSPDSKHIAYINAPAFNIGPVRIIAAEDGSPVNMPKDV